VNVRAWLAAGLLALPAGAGPVTVWRLDADATTLAPGPPDLPVAVGSLLKPFLAEAWAAAHPGEPTPRFWCGPGSGCWLHAGHGELGLAGAFSVSCNAYFVQLAADTPPETLAATLAREGFPPPRSARQALGLEANAGALAVAPSVLLRAYARLVRNPWPGAEPVRREVLAGLREAALGGTAAQLGHGGFWAKTGTVRGPDGTAGLALAVDAAGWAILARVEPGRGVDAARALAAPIDQFRPGSRTRSPVPASGPAVPWTDPRAVVRVRLFELVPARRYQVRNLGSVPVLCGGGYLGPGAARDLAPGDAAGPGLLALRDPATGLERRFQGEVGCSGRGGALRLVARMSTREYVAGIIAAELGDRPGPRLELGAAVLRFLARGPRYPDAEVGDSTRTALYLGRAARAQGFGLSDPDWEAIRSASLAPGPSQWTSDDGGRPLDAREVWGGDRPDADADSDSAPAPPARAASHPWTRTWSAAQLEQAFGAPVRGLAVGRQDGVWVLRVRCAGGTRSLRYDEAHRLLAKVLGWGALPSPADTVEPVAGGFRAAGVGLGHRVGLSLSAGPATHW
jgi:hypothetical protein